MRGARIKTRAPADDAHGPAGGQGPEADPERVAQDLPGGEAVLLPLLSARLPDRVSFRPEVSSSAQLLDFLRSVNPSCLEDKASFLRFCESLFDSWHAP
jgi:hypothetical protein